MILPSDLATAPVKYCVTVTVPCACEWCEEHTWPILATVLATTPGTHEQWTVMLHRLTSIPEYDEEFGLRCPSCGDRTRPNEVFTLREAVRLAKRERDGAPMLCRECRTIIDVMPPTDLAACAECGTLLTEKEPK